MPAVCLASHNVLDLITVFVIVSFTLREAHRYDCSFGVSAIVLGPEYESSSTQGPVLYFCPPEGGNRDDFQKVVVFKEENRRWTEYKRIVAQSPKKT
jgi:hypothetical protein